MKNKLLSITRNIIPYIKELKPFASSVTACLLWQQLDYWFEKYPDGFYKFLEPCNNKHYKKGKSWTEELGFSAKEFRNAFRKIGVKYNSKSQYVQDCENGDPFKGKYFLSYQNKSTGLTYYKRNHAAIDKVLEKIVKLPVDDQRASTEITDGNLRKRPKVIYNHLKESIMIQVTHARMKTTRRTENGKRDSQLQRTIKPCYHTSWHNRYPTSSDLHLARYFLHL